MFRDGIELRTDDNINFLLSHGALGDVIASLPAIKWARENHTLDLRMTVWAPRHLVELVDHLIGQQGLKVQPLDEFEMVRKKGHDEFAGSCVINSTLKGTVTRNRYDMVDFAFATLLDRQPMTERERSYVQGRRLIYPAIEGRYVVVPVGATNKASTFKAEVLGPFLEWLVAHETKPVLVGKPGATGVVMMDGDKPHPLTVHDEVDLLPSALLKECIDMRGKTSLIELRDMCANAQAVVGVDGGTLHLAGTTDVPIVYGCTRVLPWHRSITRRAIRNWRVTHVTPRDLECAGCQSNWTLMFKYDFSNCAYKDFKCTSALHADDFIAATEPYLFSS